MRSSAEHANIRTSSGEPLKVAYAKSEISSVEPPAGLQPPPEDAIDGLQDLINRMREAKKNRTRFHLTEADCNRMCTNATELNVASGHLIVAEGAPITNVYRIKKGQVSLMKSGVKLYDLSVGHFLGESLFIRENAQDRFGAALVANGPVVITQLNIPFVQQLLEVDRLLAFKLYRHIAQKLSGLVVSVTDNVTGNDSMSPFGSPRGHLASEMSMIRLDDELMSGVSGKESEPQASDVPFAVAPETLTSSARKARKSARKSQRLQNKSAFKKYPLEGDKDIVKLNDKKITISHEATLKKKRKIKYSEILSVSKTGSKTVTIIYNLQSKIFIFKNEADFHEFYGLVQFMVSNNKKDAKDFNADVPLFFGSDSPFAASPGRKGGATVLPPSVPGGDEKQQVTDDKTELLQLACRQDLIKGDLVIAEGDLFQRLYTVVYGRFYMKRCGRILAVLEEGDVFGVLTLFYMRPSIFSLEVASDNATLLVIPGYRIHELVNTNFALAVRLYRKAAQQIYDQIEKLLTSSEGIAKGLTESHFLL
eukprot:Phypoly_transcript_05671.p1 GENE.Phypoly_transcript_05671~~Phypoly_transcript_05671.p1  ORF type:complete len:536 (+),score=84.02 Phypoly_transcript_05671:209-1816(+)